MLHRENFLDEKYPCKMLPGQNIDIAKVNYIGPLLLFKSVFYTYPNLSNIL